VAAGPDPAGSPGSRPTEGSWDDAALAATVAALRAGRVVAIKGLGGYHLACDARDAGAVRALRERKYRKEKPFAIMARDLAALDGVVELDDAARALLASTARPIVLAPKGPLALLRSGRPCRTSSRPTTPTSASCCPTPRCSTCCSTAARPTCW
jgi:hypothetical protein